MEKPQENEIEKKEVEEVTVKKNNLLNLIILEKIQIKESIIKTLIIIDVILLFINIHFYNKPLEESGNINKFNDNNYIDFRNVDYYNMKLISNSYRGISNYLSSKFNTSNQNISLMNYSNIDTNGNIINKTVKIFYMNMHPRWIELIKESVKDKINIEIDNENPDYLIYATFGCDYINISSKYNNTIKIAFFTENQLPDLNYTDYAVGLSHISYLDRYLHLPYFIYYLQREHLPHIFLHDFSIARNKALKYKNRTKFCGAVLTNPSGYRIGFINAINNYKAIDHGVGYNNNVGGYVGDKIGFLSQYKFSIAMENSEADGYLTEKLFDAFLAGTIPIYYGDYMMDEFINPKSFILIRDENDLMEKIKYIRKIDNDDKLYESILKENIFVDNDFIEKYEKIRIEFLLNIFEQNKELAKRKDNLFF